MARLFVLVAFLLAASAEFVNKGDEDGYLSEDGEELTDKGEKKNNPGRLRVIHMHCHYNSPGFSFFWQRKLGKTFSHHSIRMATVRSLSSDVKHPV
jgi:hypothetical protein